jgi:hypothetical protein
LGELQSAMARFSRKIFFIEPRKIVGNLENSSKINNLRGLFCASPVAARRFWPIVASRIHLFRAFRIWLARPP